MLQHLVREWVTPASAPAGTQFEIRGLTGLEVLDVVNELGVGSAALLASGQVPLNRAVVQKTLHPAVSDWRCWPPDAPASFTTEGLDDLDFEMMKDLVNTIIDRSMLGEEQKKISKSPSKSSTPTPCSTAPAAPGEATATKATPARKATSKSPA